MSRRKGKASPIILPICCDSLIPSRTCLIDDQKITGHWLRLRKLGNGHRRCVRNPILMHSQLESCFAVLDDDQSLGLPTVPYISRDSATNLHGCFLYALLGPRTRGPGSKWWNLLSARPQFISHPRFLTERRGIDRRPNGLDARFQFACWSLSTGPLIQWR